MAQAPRDVRFLGLNPEWRRKAASGTRAATGRQRAADGGGRKAEGRRRTADGGRRAGGVVKRNYSLKLRLPEGPWLRAVRACAFQQPATGEASAGRLNPGATLVGGTCGCQWARRSLHAQQLPLPNDHDRYVGACQVQPLCAAPPGLGGQGPPGPPVSTVSVRAAVSACP